MLTWTHVSVLFLGTWDEGLGYLPWTAKVYVPVQNSFLEDDDTAHQDLASGHHLCSGNYLMQA